MVYWLLMISFTKLSENHILDKIFHKLMINIMFDFHEIHICMLNMYKGKNLNNYSMIFFPFAKYVDQMLRILYFMKVCWEFHKAKSDCISYNWCRYWFGQLLGSIKWSFFFLSLHDFLPLQKRFMELGLSDDLLHLTVMELRSQRQSVDLFVVLVKLVVWDR